MSALLKKVAVVAAALALTVATANVATASPYGEKGEKGHEKVEVKETKGEKKDLEVKGKSASKNTSLPYTVTGTGVSLSGTVKTDKQGKYEFTVKVPKGTYTVVVGGSSSIITVK
jgi:uncharacterized protein with LGFP repeats